MTVGVSLKRVVQVGTGSTATFYFNAPVQDDDNLAVYTYNTSTLVQTLQTKNGAATYDYTVTINASTKYATITLNNNLPTTHRVVILRNIPLTQESDYVEGDPFSAETHESALDKLTLIAAQLQEQSDRSLKVIESSATTNLTMAELEADKLIIVNSAGTALEMGPTMNDVDTVANDIANVNAVAADLTNVDTVAGNLTGSNTIGTVAGAIANVNATGSNIANVNTVAGNTTNINTVAGNLTGANTIGTVAGINADVTTVAGIAADVTAVANNEVDITQVATDIAKVIEVANDLQETTSEIDTVANSIANVDTVGTNIASVNTVAADQTNVNTVATNIANVNTVATNIADVNTVATNIANVNTVAGINADVTTVSGINANVTTVAGISGNVTTVAGISANVTSVAGNATNINTVAGNTSNINTVAGISADVTTAAGIAADITTAATNVADITNFADVYIGPSASAPSTRADGSALQAGDIFFNTTDDQMKVYTGSAWQSLGSTVNGTAARFKYVATAGQTTFTGSDANGATLAYDPGYIDVYLNGVHLDPSDYTASSGTSIVLASAAALNDELYIVAYGTFVLSAVIEQIGGTNGSAAIPVGTTAQRPTATTGQFRFNSTLGQFEGYNGSSWGSIGGGATGGGADAVFIENDQTITTNYTIPSGKNAMSTGPVSINSGVTVTVSTGSRYVVI